MQTDGPSSPTPLSMSSIALGVAFAAVQLVHQAHSKVKTSKARCARLVERCQLVVDRLERIAATRGGDAIIRERIHELERAFERTARTIVQVGQQGVIASLLQSESNALRIESCNEALSQLIALFNLEQIVDVRRWQTDLEIARVRDHRELLSLGQRIESGNAAINRELAQQGATIAEVLQVIHDISAGLQCASSFPLKIAIPLTLSDADPLQQTPTRSSPAAKVAGSALCTSCASPRSAKSKSATLRCISFTKKCAKIAPLAKVFSKLPPSLPSPSPFRGTAARSAPRGCSPITPRLTLVSGAGDNVYARDSASVSSCYSLPTEAPPPYYQLRVANPTPENECSEGGTTDGVQNVAPMSSSRFTTASIEAVRAPDSPVPELASPKPSIETAFGSTQSLASVSSGNGATTPGPSFTRRNSPAGAGPVLRRRDTISFSRHMSQNPNV